ncbi:MAG: hypothetical protein CL596_05060 [Alteromonas sp.]|nr:hypothetical protein [Alteromonas sp.]|tara:strand:- start:3061 stop:3384 length:324 start_codon:yes stop_codon:yes gene_type:complete
MAKAKAAAKTTKKKEKKESFLKDNYEAVINDYNGIRTDVMHIRGYGCIVRDVNKETGAMTSVFVPGVKPKKKKDYRYLIVDKGPKPKKDKGTKAAKSKKSKTESSED